MYTAFSREPLPNLFKLFHMGGGGGQNGPATGSHVLHTCRLKKRKVEVLHPNNFVNIINGNFFM